MKLKSKPPLPPLTRSAWKQASDSSKFIVRRTSVSVDNTVREHNALESQEVSPEASSEVSSEEISSYSV